MSNYNIDEIMAQRRERQAIRREESLAEHAESLRQQKLKLDDAFELRRRRLLMADEHHQVMEGIREERYRKDAEFAIRVLQSNDPYILRKWLHFDTWTPSQAFILLSGFDPSACIVDENGLIARPSHGELENSDSGGAGWVLPPGKTYNAQTVIGLDFDSRAVQDILGEESIREQHFNLRFHFKSLKEIWDTGTHAEVRYAPSYFVRWALSKKMNIGWLSLAQEEGFFLGDEYARASQSDAAEGKPLNTNERNTLLLIIAALAKKANFDIGAPSAASSLETAIKLIGPVVSAPTIRKKLDLIPNVIAHRSPD